MSIIEKAKVSFDITHLIISLFFSAIILILLINILITSPSRQILITKML